MAQTKMNVEKVEKEKDDLQKKGTDLEG